jgi:hypothetical protein
MSSNGVAPGRAVRTGTWTPGIDVTTKPLPHRFKHGKIGIDGLHPDLRVTRPRMTPRPNGTFTIHESGEVGVWIHVAEESDALMSG